MFDWFRANRYLQVAGVFARVVKTGAWLAATYVEVLGVIRVAPAGFEKVPEKKCRRRGKKVTGRLVA